MIYANGNDPKIKILIEDFVLLDDTIWFCAQNFNGLYSKNLITNEVVLCGEFPNEIYSKPRLFASMKLVGRKIYFIPFYAKTIVIYDIDSHVFSSIEINEAVCGAQGNMLFMGIQQYKNYLFIIPVQASKIIRLNTIDNSIVYITEWYEMSKDILFDKVYFRKQTILIEGKLYAPFYSANALLEMDCDTLKTTVHKLGSDKRGYSGICFDGKNIWIAPTNSKCLVQWDIRTHTMNESNQDKEMQFQGGYPYTGIVCHEENILAFPVGKVLGENHINDKVKIMNGKFSFVKDEKDYIAYYENELGRLTVVDKVNGGEKNIEITVDSKKIDIARLIKETEKVKVETKSFGIKQYIGSLVEDYSTFFAV